MFSWWRVLPFRRQAFIIMTAAICAAIVVLELLVEPILESNSISVTGGIDWYEAPFWLFVILVVGAAVVAIFTRVVIQRLTRLSRFTEEIMRGNFSYRVPTQEGTDDIFNKLALSFNAMAKTIDEMMHNEQRLLSDISHELRSPLARISATIELLLMRNSDNNNTAYLRKAEGELAHMTHLVGMLLEQSRSRLAMRDGRETLDLSAAAMEMADSFQMQGVTQRRGLLSDIVPGIRVDGHPLQIRLIIENLLANALFYTPPESRVEFRLYHSNENARLTVRDFGPGVPEEHLKSIFRPFFRVDASRGRKYGGIGLGLTLVREASEALGGSVEAQNTRPGLEVSVLLPLSKSCRTTAQAAKRRW